MRYTALAKRQGSPRRSETRSLSHWASTSSTTVYSPALVWLSSPSTSSLCATVEMLDKSNSGCPLLAGVENHGLWPLAILGLNSAFQLVRICNCELLQSIDVTPSFEDPKY